MATAGIPSAGSTRRRFGHVWSDLAVVLLALAAIVVNLAPVPLTAEAEGTWNDLSWTLAPLLVLLKAASTARHSVGNRRQAWRLIALGCLSWFLGMLAWDYHHLIHGVYPPYPGLPDLGYLGAAPLITLGIIYFRQEAITPAFMLHQLTRIGVVFFALLLIHYLIYSALLKSPEVSVLYVVTSLSYPLLFFTSVIHAVSDTWYRYDGTTQRTLLLIVAGMGIHALANAEYAYSLLAQDYYSSSYVDIAWTVGYLPIYFAACLHRDADGRTAAPPNHHVTRLFEAINKGFLPLLLLALSVTIFYTRKPITEASGDGFAVLIAGFTVLLVVYFWISEQKERNFARQLYAKDLVLNSLVEAIPYGIQEIDLAGNIVYGNEAMHGILAAPPDSLVRRKLWHCAPDKAAVEHLRRQFRQLVEAGQPRGSYTLPARRDDGVMVTLKTDWTHRHSPQGRLTGIVAVVTDITCQQKNEEQLRQAAAVFSSTADAVVVTDSAKRIMTVNDAFLKISGHAEADVLGREPRVFQSDRHPEEFYANIWACLADGSPWDGEVWNVNAAGEAYPSWTRISAVRQEDYAIQNYILVFSDITRIKQSEEHLRFLAHHDALTLLPNRTQLDIELEHAIHRADRQRQPFGLFFIDLDQFKHINDSLGHAIGDRILVEAADRLKRIARSEDTVARIGGDEFVLVVEHMETVHDSNAVAERILTAFEAPFEIDELRLHLTPSVGIAMYPDNGREPEALLKNADAAMYRAKHEGRNGFAYYSQELTVKATERIKYENLLRSALENNELSLRYQPQIDIAARRVHGVEVLLQWETAAEGVIAPSIFIPIAEESGLISPIGQWVLRESCACMRRLLALGIDLRHISVNVSAVQFLREQFVETVARTLEETGLDGRYLELEITESVIMNDRIKSIDALHRLAELGVSLSIDDFGTGYSSLSYLKTLPVDCIKIDQSFIRYIPRDRDDVAITRSILALGRSLDLEIIAEGVELPDQLRFLQKEHCHLVQGFLFSRPVTEDELRALLQQPDPLFEAIDPPSPMSLQTART